MIRSFGFSISIIMAVALSGCASFQSESLNLSHHQEVAQYLTHLNSTLSLRNHYQLRILPNDEMQETHGVPAISGTMVLLPEDFIKYVYAYYYDHRAQIMTCVFAHEICHTEFGLPSKPPNVHVQTDQAAIKLLGVNPETLSNYYNSLRVVQKYWTASRSRIGRVGNLAWNAASAASMVYGGPGLFMDWYATDLKVRIKQLRKAYPDFPRRGFKRSSHNQ